MFFFVSVFSDSRAKRPHLFPLSMWPVLSPLLTGKAQEWGTALWDSNASVCAKFGASLLHVSTKRQHPSVDAGLLVGTAQGNLPTKHSLLPIMLLMSDGALALVALIFSGADKSFICAATAHQLKIPLLPLDRPLPTYAINGQRLMHITHVPEPVLMQISGNHSEHISFHVMDSPHVPIFLAFSRVFSPEEEPSSPETILTPKCLVRAELLGIESRELKAQIQEPSPGNGPPNCLFVPPSVRPDVLTWHGSKLPCHPDVARK